MKKDRALLRILLTVINNSTYQMLLQVKSKTSFAGRAISTNL